MQKEDPDFDLDIAGFMPRQMAALELLDSGEIKYLLYGGALGGGKLLSVDTPIPTPDGWTTMGDLLPGDTVFDDTGNPCSVINVSEIQREATYRITFSDGSAIIAGGRHQWVTSTLFERQRKLRGSDAWRADRRSKRPSRATGKRSKIFTESITARNKSIPTPILDLPTSGIRTTKEILDTLYNGVSLNHCISVAGPLELPESSLPIDPYVLGAWLGDGSSNGGDITGLDDEIFDHISTAGYTVTRHACIKTRGVLKLSAQLKTIGVRNNKHIPSQYLRSSKTQRLSLLQGLMDTDGTVDKRGQCEIQLTRKVLIDGVQELIHSLGIKVQMRTGRATLYGKYCGEKYRLKFMTHLPAFRLKRKLDRQKRDGFRGTHDVRYIVSVIPVDRVPLKCIEVDSPSHQYLCGKEMIPTHNSRFLRWYAIRRLIKLYQLFGITNALGMLACEDYPSLKDRQLQKISTEIPPWIGRMHGDHRDYGRCFILTPRWGSGVIAFRNLDDPSKYASAEFAFILVDELTKNPYEVFTFLRTRLRWPGLPDVHTQFVGATNPGSIGHGWVKQLWMDKKFPAEWISPIDYRSQFAYVPSKADDNPHLDEAYWATLATLPENLRKAFRDGDWNIFLGQAFPEFSETTHVIDGPPVPTNAQIYMTYDWGFGAPFSILWWWVDADGRLYLFDEWYGYSGTANQGLRINDSTVAEGINAREKEMQIGIDRGRYVGRLAGPDCFQKKPDYKGGGQGPSTAETFANADPKLFLVSGNPDRALKIRQFRERLKVPADGSMPMLVVYRKCKEFIRTISNLIMDEKNIEDVDTKGEDHAFDAAALMCMSRPLSLVVPLSTESSYDKRIDAIKRGPVDGYEREAIMDQDLTMRQLDIRGMDGDVMEYDDGLRGTV
jgi:hypothetical protein